MEFVAAVKELEKKYARELKELNEKHSHEKLESEKQIQLTERRLAQTAKKVRDVETEITGIRRRVDRHHKK